MFDVTGDNLDVVSLRVVEGVEPLMRGAHSVERGSVVPEPREYLLRDR